jgi:hypothetical protein
MNALSFLVARSVAGTSAPSDFFAGNVFASPMLKSWRLEEFRAEHYES